MDMLYLVTIQMGHHHHHHVAEKRIASAFFINLVFTIIEIIGGFYTQSFAILSDALHDLGDSVSLGLSWYFQRLSGKGRTKDFTYGYRRFSVLGALINAIILIVGSFVILYEAIPSLWDPNQADAQGMLIFSIFGILFNGIAAYRMSSGKLLNEKVVYLHLLEDVLGWTAVLAGSIVMILFDFPIIDPLLSILITLFILYNVIRNLRKSLNIFLQGTPENITESAIRERILSIDSVCDIHDCHAWTMDGEYNILTVHVVLKDNPDLSELSQIRGKVKTALEDLNIDHLTLEFETCDQECEFVDC